MMQEQGMPGQTMPGEMAEEDGAPPEQDQGYVSATTYIMQTLYENGAAEMVAQAVREPGDDPMTVIADIAYTAVDEADAQAQPPMQEENLVPLAVFTLSELWEIAGAALNQEDEVDPAMVAGSFKMMILRFMQESGADTTQLQQAFDQVTPDQIRQLNAEEVQDGTAI